MECYLISVLNVNCLVRLTVKSHVMKRQDDWTVCSCSSYHCAVEFSIWSFNIFLLKEIKSFLKTSSNVFACVCGDKAFKAGCFYEFVNKILFI